MYNVLKRIRNNIKCMAEGLTPCLMQGYEKFLSENYIPETQIRGKDFQNTDDFTSQRINEGKMKFKQCKKCKWENICEGPWREYPEKRGNKEFVEVRE